jgi:hypothetical protein
MPEVLLMADRVSDHVEGLVVKEGQTDIKSHNLISKKLHNKVSHHAVLSILFRLQPI